MGLTCVQHKLIKDSQRHSVVVAHAPSHCCPGLTSCRDRDTLRLCRSLDQGAGACS